MRPIHKVLTVLIASVILAACGTSTAQNPTTVPDVAVAPSATGAAVIQSTSTAAPSAPTATLLTTAPTSASTATRPDATPNLLVVPTRAATAVNESPIVRQARTALLAQPGLGQQTLAVQSEKEVEWPTSALGCPEPGKMYLQVITPGVQIVFSDGARTYDINTTRTGDALIWCDSGTAKMIGASK